MSRGAIESLEFSTTCPNCGYELICEVRMTVTSYQPSGPPGTPLRTLISTRLADSGSRILLSHDCPPQGLSDGSAAGE